MLPQVYLISVPWKALKRMLHLELHAALGRKQQYSLRGAIIPFYFRRYSQFLSFCFFFLLYVQLYSYSIFYSFTLVFYS
jgi:hypothetical protein